jgi:hypothetical protein
MKVPANLGVKSFMTSEKTSDPILPSLGMQRYGGRAVKEGEYTNGSKPTNLPKTHD